MPSSPTMAFFFDRRPVPFGGSRHLRLTRLPRHDRGPVPGGNRSAASCLCTVLRRALYHYATRSPNCCGSNPIPKRRQQRVGPAEPLVSTAMRQGEGREGKRQRATQPHTTRNKPKGGEQGKGTSRKKRQQDTTRKNSTTRTKASKATRKRLGRGNRPRESHQGNRHTCTYQKSERGAK